jgi:hypothetical protein
MVEEYQALFLDERRNENDGMMGQKCSERAFLIIEGVMGEICTYQ